MPLCRQQRASRRIKIMTWTAGSFLLSLQTIRQKHIFPNLSIWMQYSQSGQRMNILCAKCKSVGPPFWDFDTWLVRVVWGPCTQRGGDSVCRCLYISFWSGTWQIGWITMWSSCWSPCGPGGAQGVMIEHALPLWHSQRKVSEGIFTPAPNTVCGCIAVEIHLSPLLCLLFICWDLISRLSSRKALSLFLLFFFFLLLTHSLSMTSPNEGLSKTKEFYSK